MPAATLRHSCCLILAFFIAIQAAPSVAAADATKDLYLVNARLVDPAARKVQRGNLLIRNGVIVGTPRKPPADFTGKTLDLQGKWIIPGLVDMHTHTFGNVDPAGPNDMPRTVAVAHRLLYAGVTSFLDLFGDENDLFNTREQQRAGKLGGADMFASLTCLTATGGHGTEYGVKARTTDSPEQARRAVEDLKSKHPDVVKIIYERGMDRPAIDKATLIAAVSAAKANGLKTVVHVSSWDNVRDAVEAGATAVTHTPGPLIPEDLARLMAAKKVVSIPTLVLHTDYGDFIEKPEVLDSPLAHAVTTPAVIAAYRSANVKADYEKFRVRYAARRSETLKSVKTMADAGVEILAGTDSGSTGTLQGYSVHRELIKMVEAGLSPWQALAAATTDAGTFLGRVYGMKKGSEANLVVLDASPIEEIGNTQRIAYVIHHGRVVDRQREIAPEVAGLPY